MVLLELKVFEILFQYFLLYKVYKEYMEIFSLKGVPKMGSEGVNSKENKAFLKYEIDGEREGRKLPFNKVKASQL